MAPQSKSWRGQPATTRAAAHTPTTGGTAPTPRSAARSAATSPGRVVGAPLSPGPQPRRAAPGPRRFSPCPACAPGYDEYRYQALDALIIVPTGTGWIDLAAVAE